MSARWATHVSVTARLRSAAASDKTPLAEAAVGNIIVYDDDKKLLGVGLKKKTSRGQTQLNNRSMMVKAME